MSIAAKKQPCGIFVLSSAVRCNGESGSAKTSIPGTRTRVLTTHEQRFRIPCISSSSKSVQELHADQKYRLSSSDNKPIALDQYITRKFKPWRVQLIDVSENICSLRYYGVDEFRHSRRSRYRRLRAATFIRSPSRHSNDRRGPVSQPSSLLQAKASPAPSLFRPPTHSTLDSLVRAHGTT